MSANAHSSGRKTKTTKGLAGLTKEIIVTKVRDPKKSTKRKPEKKSTSFSFKDRAIVTKINREIEPMVGVRNQFELFRERFNVRHHKDGVIVEGSCLVAELYSNTTTEASAAMTIPLHPGCLNSWQLARMAQNYQKFRFTDVSVELISQLGSNTTGNIFGAIYPSNETVPSLNGIGLKKFLRANRSFQEVACWQRLAFAMGKSPFLPAYNTQLLDDYSTSIQGNIVLGSTNLDETYIGDAIVHYTVRLSGLTSPNVNDTSGTKLVLALPSSGSETLSSLTWTYTNPDPAYTYWKQFPGIWQITTRSEIGFTSLVPSTIAKGTTLFMKVTNYSSTSIKIYICSTYTEALAAIPIEKLGSSSSGTFLPMNLYGFWISSVGEMMANAPVVPEITDKVNKQDLDEVQRGLS